MGQGSLLCKSSFEEEEASHVQDKARVDKELSVFEDLRKGWHV